MDKCIVVPKITDDTLESFKSSIKTQLLVNGDSDFNIFKRLEKENENVCKALFLIFAAYSKIVHEEIKNEKEAEVIDDYLFPAIVDAASVVYRLIEMQLSSNDMEKKFKL